MGHNTSVGHNWIFGGLLTGANQKMQSILECNTANKMAMLPGGTGEAARHSGVDAAATADEVDCGGEKIKKQCCAVVKKGNPRKGYAGPCEQGNPGLRAQ